MNRRVNFQAMRKTWQTLGVRFGLSQRVAQDILGHSDPALTANVYTDMPAVGAYNEVAKLPRIGDAQLHSQISPKTNVFGRFREIVGELAELAKTVGAEGFTTESAPLSAGVKWLPGLGSNQRPSD